MARHGQTSSCVSTYFVTSFKALRFYSSVSVNVDCDTGSVLGSEYIVDLADKLLFLSPNAASKKGNCVSLDHANDLAFTVVGYFCDHHDSLRRTTV